MVLKELNFNSFSFGRGLVVLKELILKYISLWEDVVVLKELNFNSFSFGRLWWS